MCVYVILFKSEISSCARIQVQPPIEIIVIKCQCGKHTKCSLHNELEGDGEKQRQRPRRKKQKIKKELF